MNNLTSLGIIKDLLRIQHDRATAYEKMLKYNSENETTCKFLKKIILQSRNSILELRAHMTEITRGEPADRVRVSSDINQSWPGIKAVLTETSPNEILLSCEFNEEIVLSAYQKVLTTGEGMPNELRLLIYNQLNRIRESFLFILSHKERPFAPETVNDRKPWRSSVTQERFVVSEF